MSSDCGRGDSVDNLVSEAAVRFLSVQCPPASVRAISAGASADGLWASLEESGFADALLLDDGSNEEAVVNAFKIAEQCGAHVTPVPLVETMVARALLGASNIAPPSGPISIAEGAFQQDGGWRCATVICGRTAKHVLVHLPGGEWRVLPTEMAERKAVADVLDASLSWNRQRLEQADIPTFASKDIHGRTVLATILAALISGAARAVFEQSLQYANERQQFGRSIGKFQAVQHRLAVMAEQVVAAQMAAQLAWNRMPLGSDPLRVAVAKARCSEAATAVAEGAHAIHGALGFTEECSLQLWTRRLYAWRNAAGSESYWHTIAGQLLLGGPSQITLDAIRRVTDDAQRPVVRHQETLQCHS